MAITWKRYIGLSTDISPLGFILGVFSALPGLVAQEESP